MSKSVLVINTPKYCALCVLRSGVHHPFCRVNNRDITDLSIRPDWCPLQPLPEKSDTKMTGADWNCGYNDGWNACVDEIIIRSKSPEEIIKYYENKNIQIKRKAAQEAQTSALTTPLKKPLSNAMFNGMLWKIV